MITEKTISNFLSNEYKEFAMYVVESRAIPSYIDSFKTSQRKIIHAANQIWKNGNEKPLKVFQLAGSVANISFYHHGNVSLENAIVNMAQKFKNNATLLDGIGQFGSIRSPQAAASRYIETKLSENFKLIYKDFELLEYKEEEGEKIEPKFFLPIIPTVLINGSSGIAVGFASNILNRNIKEIIDCCLKLLNNKNIEEVKPYLNEFNGEFIQDPENNKKWYIRGKFDRLKNSTIRITELPPSTTYEKYEDILDKLIEDKIIINYDDNCKDNVNYIVKFNKSEIENIDDEKLIKILKLEETTTEIYSTIDENGKLKIFESSVDIIKHFIEFRLKYYNKRKEFLIDKLNKDLKILSNKGKFIKAILDNKLKINNIPKIEIVSKIEELKIDKIEESYDYLLKMPIYSLTKEMFNKLKEDFTVKKEEVKKLEETNPKDIYINDLIELRKKLK